MPISFHQLRAARSLLDISQSTVASAVGMSTPQLSNYESGVKKAKSTTLAKLEDFYKLKGIEFTNHDGVRRSPPIVTLEGTDGFRAFMDDVYETAKETGGDICLFYTQPELWIKHLGKEWYAMHSERMVALGDRINVRIIINEENFNYILKCAEYRWTTKGRVQDTMFYCYGNKLGILNFKNDPIKITVIAEDGLAEAFQLLFESTWQHDTLPAKPE